MTRGCPLSFGTVPLSGHEIWKNTFLLINSEEFVIKSSNWSQWRHLEALKTKSYSQDFDLIVLFPNGGSTNLKNAQNLIWNCISETFWGIVMKLGTYQTFSPEVTCSFGTLPSNGQEIAKNGLFLAYNFWTLSCMITIVPSWAVSEQHHILDKNSK